MKRQIMCILRLRIVNHLWSLLALAITDNINTSNLLVSVCTALSILPVAT